MYLSSLILRGLAAITVILAYESVSSSPQLSNDARIVGGVDATQGQIPYILALYEEGYLVCGASIIEVSGVVLAITAAHCVARSKPENIGLVAGEVSLKNYVGIEQARKVTQIVVHEEFFGLTFQNDIALLFLDEPFELNDNVKPVPLPEQGQAVSGNILVSGWGRLQYSGDTPDNLQIVEVPLVDNEICKERYRGRKPIYETQICAGFLEKGGKDACNGDSGGPAVSIDEGYLAGLVSHGQGCADRRFPGVYTKTSEYVDWITQTVANKAF